MATKENMAAASLANLKPGTAAAAYKGEREKLTITVSPETKEYLLRIAAEGKALKNGVKNFGCGDAIDGLVDFAAIAETNPDAIDPSECRLYMLQLLE